MVVKREDGPLLAIVVGLISGTLCGYGPSLFRIKQWHLEWIWRMCPGVSCPLDKIEDLPLVKAHG